MSADELALLAERGWIHSTLEGMWEHPERVGGPVSLPEALELELGGQAPAGDSRPDPDNA